MTGIWSTKAALQYKAVVGWGRAVWTASRVCLDRVGQEGGNEAQAEALAGLCASLTTSFAGITRPALLEPNSASPEPAADNINMGLAAFSKTMGEFLDTLGA